MITKVYTRTGDAGMTSLVSGNRVSKDDVRVEAYGTVDELNSNIGVLMHSSKLDDPDIVALLRKAQNKLFNIGAYLANDRKDATLYGLTQEGRCQSTGEDAGRDERGAAAHDGLCAAWRNKIVGPGRPLPHHHAPC